MLKSKLDNLQNNYIIYTAIKLWLLKLKPNICVRNLYR